MHVSNYASKSPLFYDYTDYTVRDGRAYGADHIRRIVDLSWTQPEVEDGLRGSIFGSALHGVTILDARCLP